MKFSIIIPTLNEGQTIKSCIEKIHAAAAGESIEIIIADGGSSDATSSIAELLKADVVHSQKGRGTQLNAGARKACGDILIFLHADTLLPEDAFTILKKAFKNTSVQAGKFRMRFDEQNILFAVYALFTRFDSVFTSFGDQCITVRRSFYTELGGFKEWPLFEDVEFLQRARKVTRIFSFKSYVTTSARRFKKNGILRQQIINSRLIFKYLRGASSQELADEYRK